MKNKLDLKQIKTDFIIKITWFQTQDILKRFLSSSKMGLKVSRQKWSSFILTTSDTRSLFICRFRDKKKKKTISQFFTLQKHYFLSPPNFVEHLREINYAKENHVVPPVERLDPKNVLYGWLILIWGISFSTGS